MDLKYTLVDGILVAQPKYAWWFDGPGCGVENYGVDPDVEVPIAPHDWAATPDSTPPSGSPCRRSSSTS